MKRNAVEIPSPEEHPDVIAATQLLNEITGRRQDLEARLAAARQERANRPREEVSRAARELLGDQVASDGPSEHEDIDHLAVGLEAARQAGSIAHERLDRARDEVSRDLGESFQPVYNQIVARFAKLLLALGEVAAEAEQVRRLAEGSGLSFQRKDLSSYRTDRPGTRTVLLLDDLADRLGVEVPEGRATGQEPQGVRLVG